MLSIRSEKGRKGERERKEGRKKETFRGNFGRKKQYVQPEGLVQMENSHLPCIANSVSKLKV